MNRQIISFTVIHVSTFDSTLFLSPLLYVKLDISELQCTRDADRRDDLRQYVHVRGWNFAKANVSSSCKRAPPAQECIRSDY